MSTLNLSGAISLGRLPSAPSNPKEGVLYFDQGLGQYRFYRGGAFVNVPSTAEVESLINAATAAAVEDQIVDGVTDKAPSQNAVFDALALKLDASQKGAANGVATLDANQLIPITQIPPAAIERLVIVADETARFALTTATVQNGDTVKQTDTGSMYFVKDDTNLDSALGYEEYTAGAASTVAWSGVTGTPTTIAGYGITDAGDVAKAAAVADEINDGTTDVAPSQNAVFDALALKADAADLANKLENVVEDTTPQLGGPLDLNSQTVEGDMKRAALGDSSNFIVEKYLHTISLLGSQTDTVIASLQFAHAEFEGCEITFKIKEATSSDIKIGTLRVVTNGTAVAINEVFVETADTGISFTAVVNGANIDIRYSSGANAATMRADVKLFKV